MSAERLEARPIHDYTFAGVIGIIGLGILAYAESPVAVTLGASYIALAALIAKYRPTSRPQS